LVVPVSQVAALGLSRVGGGYGSPDGSETITLDLGELADLKLAAIARHVSQTGSAGPFHDWDTSARNRYLATESYRLARSNLPRPASESKPVESDLFDGLP